MNACIRFFGCNIHRKPFHCGIHGLRFSLVNFLACQQVQKYGRGANRVGASRLFDLSRVLDVPVSFFFDDMSEEVEALSPRLISGLAEEPAGMDMDPMTKRETLELVRAYYRITDPQVRRRVLDLAKALGASFEE